VNSTATGTPASITASTSQSEIMLDFCWFLLSCNGFKEMHENKNKKQQARPWCLSISFDGYLFLLYPRFTIFLRPLDIHVQCSMWNVYEEVNQSNMEE
jgi:hypothetical protein